MIPVTFGKMHLFDASFFHSESSFVMFLALKFVVFIKYWFGFSVDFSKLFVDLLDFKVTVLVDGAFL